MSWRLTWHRGSKQTYVTKNQEFENSETSKENSISGIKAVLKI